MRAREFTLFEQDTVSGPLENLGYKNVKKSGNFLIVIVDIPSGQANLKFRVETLKKIADELTKMGVNASYNPIQTSKSSIGFVEIENNPIKVIVKDEKKQGENRAGVANEHELVKIINEQIKQYGSIDVVFQDDRNKMLELRGVNKAIAAGTDTKGGKKADIVLYNKNQRLPISIKQTDAEVWESADSLFGSRARVIVDKLLDRKEIELQEKGSIQIKGQIKPVYRLSREIVVEPTSEDAMRAIFGSDLNPQGGIVVQDFQPHHFVQYDDTIIIDCYAVIKTKEDIPDSHVMYFLIKNMPGRASLGYYGLGTQAVTMTRAFGKGLTKNPIFVDQQANSIPPPPPRDPSVIT